MHKRAEEKRLRREEGPVVFAEYQYAVKAAVERNADTGNVVRFRPHRRME